MIQATTAAPWPLLIKKSHALTLDLKTQHTKARI
jgi:hypothetical protein